MTMMRISQLAERSGVPATTLRFYEGAGLLPASRAASGYRQYGQDAVARLAFIGSAKQLGLALEEIGELLAVWQAGTCAQVKTDLRPRLAARLAEAEARTGELAAFTSTLRGALEHLDALPDRQSRCDPRCGFLAPAASAPVTARPVEVDFAPNRQVAEAQAERWRAAPVACSLTGDGQRERITQWRAALDAAVRVQIPGGLRLTVPVERAAVVAGLAAAEQTCCGFFDFRLHLDGPDLHLEVRAPAEGALMLAELFAPTR